MKLGVALGGGAARGLAHIGVLRELEAAGYRPDVVCGTSMGAFVAAAYASGRLDALEAFARKLDRSRVLSFFDFVFKGGLIQARRLFDFLAEDLPDIPCEALPIAFGAVATDLETGHEVWLRTGSLHSAVRASIALPGLIAPVYKDGRWLTDGGVSNPVPVSLCRALGATVVVAVEIEANARAEFPAPRAEADPPTHDEAEIPSMMEVVSQVVYLLQVRVSRFRIASDPPELHVRPQMAHVGLLDFHRADEAIQEGARAVRVAIAGSRLLDPNRRPSLDEVFGPQAAPPPPEPPADVPAAAPAEEGAPPAIVSAS